MALLIICYTKLLEESDDIDLAFIVLRLARCELLLAALTRNQLNNKAALNMAEESIIRFQQLIEYTGSEIMSIRDGDLVFVSPFSGYINMAFGHRILDNHMQAKDCLDLATMRLEELFTDEQAVAKNLIRSNIFEARKLIQS